MQPVIRCCRDRNARGWNDMVASRAAAPTRTSSPAGASACHRLLHHGRVADDLERVVDRARTASPGASASRRAARAGAAPAALVGVRSATIRAGACQPARPTTTFSPTPPAPKTATESPSLRPRPSRARAPTPVTTAQPTSAACSSGTSAPHRDRACSRQHDVVAEAARRSASPRPARRHGTCRGPGKPDDRLAEVRPPRRQRRQRPHGTFQQTSTGSPCARSPSTPLPDRLDLPRALVPEQDRREPRIPGLRDVGVAEPSRQHPNAHLPRARAGRRSAPGGGAAHPARPGRARAS